MKRALVLAAAVIALVGLVSVYAQDVALMNMPFKFTVGKTVMQPGKYRVTVSVDESMVTMTPERGQAAMVAAITRLGQHAKMNDATLIFDRVGEDYTLSEVWLPGQDGYLVHDTKTPHKHHIVKAEPKTQN